MGADRANTHDEAERTFWRIELSVIRMLAVSL
jgi:hypothetical protein